MNNFLFMTIINCCYDLMKYFSRLSFGKSLNFLKVVQQLPSFQVLHNTICLKSLLYYKKVVNLNNIWMVQGFDCFRLGEYILNILCILQSSCISYLDSHLLFGLFMHSQIYLTETSLTQNSNHLIL